MSEYEMPFVNPFRRSDWSGNTLDWTGKEIADLPEDESVVKRVVWSYQDNDRWDGQVAAIVELVDGRFASWESWYGPTGDGFNRDAYGGDSIVTITLNVPDAIQMGLSGSHAAVAADAILGQEAVRRLAERDVGAGMGDYVERVDDSTA